MKTKIIAVIMAVCLLVPVCLCAIPASAADSTIKAGTYTFNDTIDFDNLTKQTYYPINFILPTIDYEGLSYNYTCSYISYYDDVGGKTLVYYANVYQNVSLVSELQPVSVYDETDGWYDPFGTGKFGQTIIIKTDQSVDSTFYEWFIANTSSESEEPETVKIGIGRYWSSTGYLNLEPLDISWMGEGYSYNYPLSVNFYNSTTDLYKTGAGLSFEVTEYTDANNFTLRVDMYDADANYIYLFEVDAVDGVYNLVSTRNGFISIYNEGTFDYDGGILFYALFEPYEVVEDENIFKLFFEGVIEALKVPVYGDFSFWSILTGILGLMLVIWLLKVLAGG